MLAAERSRRRASRRRRNDGQIVRTLQIGLPNTLQDNESGLDALCADDRHAVSDPLGDDISSVRAVRRQSPHAISGSSRRRAVTQRRGQRSEGSTYPRPPVDHAGRRKTHRGQPQIKGRQALDPDPTTGGTDSRQACRHTAAI